MAMRNLVLNRYTKATPSLFLAGVGITCHIKWNILDYSGYLIYETIVCWNIWENFKEYMDDIWVKQIKEFSPPNL